MKWPFSVHVDERVSLLLLPADLDDFEAEAEAEVLIRLDAQFSQSLITNSTFILIHYVLADTKM